MSHSHKILTRIVVKLVLFRNHMGMSIVVPSICEIGDLLVNSYGRTHRDIIMNRNPSQIKTYVYEGLNMYKVT